MHEEGAMWTYAELSLWLAPSMRGRDNPRATTADGLRFTEAADAYYLKGELSGFRRKDLTIEVKGRELELRAARERGFWRPEHVAHREVFVLPDGADPTDIDAHFAKGELSIRIAKVASARCRHIPIRVSGAPLPTTPDTDQSAALTVTSSLPTSFFGNVARALETLGRKVRAFFGQPRST
jgi:HSP20 family molecular chaperone IbpA